MRRFPRPRRMPWTERGDGPPGWPPPGSGVRAGRARRRSAPVLRAVVATALASIAVVLVPAPASAAPGLLWTVTVDPGSGPVAERPVRVTGAVGHLLARPNRVVARLSPTVDLPAGCGPFPVEAEAVPAGGRYVVDLAPRCNGPYRVEVEAFHGGLLPGRSGPVHGSVAVAVPGTAPAAPSVTGDGGVVSVAWVPVAGPDVVGWSVEREGATARDVSASTLRLDEVAGPGHHAYRLRVLRWGAEGPAGPRVASPRSAPAAVDVSAPVVDPPATAAEPDGGGAGGGPPTGAAPTGGGLAGDGSVPAGGPGGTAAPPAGGPRPGAGFGPVAPAPAPRLPGVPPTRVPAGGGAVPPAREDPGFRERLPYDTARPPDEPAAAAGADDDQQAAGLPRSQVVSSTERVGTGLLVPFTVAAALAAGAGGLAWLLRRSRPDPWSDPEPSDALDPTDPDLV